MRRLTTMLIAAAAVLAVSPPVDAANREHEQILADIRMLQEQNQRLQLALATLGETLAKLSAKIDEQGSAARKGFADQKLLVDNVGADLRVLREKVDETNVRLSSLSQDVEGLRELIPPMSMAPAMPLPGTGTTGDGTTPADPAASASAPPGGESTAPAPASPAGPIATGTTPRRLFESALADYTAGQWSLAVNGFETYLKTYPRSERADEAQYYIGESYSADSKFREAVAAYERVIRDYPESDILDQAWYKVGISYERLGEPDKAREAYETAVKNYPETDGGRLARQRLEGLNRRP